MKVSFQPLGKTSFMGYEIKRDSFDYVPKQDRDFVNKTADLCEPFFEKQTDEIDLTMQVKQHKNDNVHISLQKEGKTFAMTFPTEAIKQFQEHGIWFPKFLSVYIEKFKKTVDNFDKGEDLGLHMEMMKKYPEVLQETMENK